MLHPESILEAKERSRLPPVAFRCRSAAQNINRPMKRPEDYCNVASGRRGTERHLFDRHRKYFSGHRLGAGFRTTPTLKYAHAHRTIQTKRYARSLLSFRSSALWSSPYALRVSRVFRVRRPQHAGRPDDSNRFEMYLPSTRATWVVKPRRHPFLLLLREPGSPVSPLSTLAGQQEIVRSGW